MEVKSLIDKKKFLIDYSNLKQKIIKSQKNFTSYKSALNILSKPYLGIPLILPANIKYFKYNKKNVFKISKKTIQKRLFTTSNKNYTPLKNFFAFGEHFVSNPIIKSEYLKYVKNISKKNQELINKLNLFKKQGKTIGSFQTRNIPHFGHEELIKKLLKKCDIVFINPVCGVKKKGDVKTKILKLSYEFLINKYYKKKLIFAPLYASMFYAGPREAIHHALLRQNLGFDYFAIGRDHAGAEGNYNPNSAINLVRKYLKNFRIKFVFSKSIYFCNKCSKVVTAVTKKKTHKCGRHKLKSISGTEFRNCIIKKKLFKYARRDLQKYIHDLENKIFY